jgi:hypothetical protein
LNKTLAAPALELLALADSFDPIRKDTLHQPSPN